MQEAAGGIPSLSKLGRLANGRKFDALEGAWLRAVEAGAYAPEDLMPIPGQVGRLGEPRRAEGLFQVLLESVEQRGGAGAGLALARLAAAEMPGSEVVRRETLRLLRAVHGDLDELEPLLAAVMPGREPLDRELVLLDAFLARWPGTYVRDREQLAPGRVESLDPERAAVEVDFEGRRQEYGRHHLERLVPLPADYFPALVRYEPERLRELAAERPVELVRLAIEGNSEQRLRYRDLKRLLGQLLGEEAWGEWWRGARSALRREPGIEVGGGSQPGFRLATRPRSWEERLREEFDGAADPLDRLDVVFGYLDETGGSGGGRRERPEADPELLVHLGNGAARLAVAALDAEPAVALAALAAHAEVADRGVAVARPSPRAAAHVLSRLDDPAQLPLKLPDELLQRALQYLRRSLPERWPAIWAAVMPRCGRRTCDLIARTLVEAGQREELARAVGEIVERPTTSPEALVWLWRAHHGSSIAGELAAIPGADRTSVVAALVSLADAAGRLAVAGGNARHRRTLDSVRQALTLQGAHPVRDVLMGLDQADAARLRDLVQDNAGLPAGLRGQLLSMLRSAHPELFVVEERPWEQAVLWSTEDALRRRQQELDHIIREEIPLVAKQIGEAAAFGDLSENSEYTAALEKRDQLTSRAATMENDLKLAKVIRPGMGAGPGVSVGSRVTVTDLGSDQTRTFTFLGPWDADPERGVLSYDAPMSKAFMGRRPGDEVAFGEGEEQSRWRVEAVESAV